MDLTQQQRDAIETTAPLVCVDAGAGSGKTFVLVQRMAHLLEHRLADLDEIVAITFTEKAAAEMKARLRRTFREQAGRHAETMKFWRELEQRLDGARISTIHAFCMRLLKENALALGIDPDFGLLTDAENRMESERIARDTIHDMLAGEDAAAITLARQYRVSRITEMMAELLPQGYALEPGAAPFDYGAPAALMDAWRARVEEELTTAVRAPHTTERLRELDGTLRFIGDCCTEPTDKMEAARRAAAGVIQTLLSDKLSLERLVALRRELKACDLRGGSKKNWEPPEALADAKEAVREARTLLETLLPEASTPEDEARAAEFTCALMAVFRRTWEAWQAHKQQRRAMSFDDLIHQTERALRRPEVCAETARGIRFLLIDEFQDTDGAQLAIAQALNTAPDGPALFIVGDPKQSIYRFRGADVTVFQIERDRAAGHVLPLNQNFRTVRPILEFVNDFFQRSGLLSAVEKEFLGLAAYRAAEDAPRIEFLAAQPADEDDKRKAKESRQMEAALIAARIAELCGPAGPETVWDAKAERFRRAQPGDFAILMRAMSNVHLYEEALRRTGIEYGLTAGSGFYERQEVLDILNLLKVALDPWDEPALLACLRSPVCGLSDDAIYAVCREAPLSRAFADGLVPQELPDGEPLGDAWALLRELHEARYLPAGEFMERLLERTKYEAVLQALPMGLQRASNLRKLADLASGMGTTSLRGLMRYLDEMRSRAIREGDAGMQPSETGAVTIMTVHKSKGLEFPIVFLADSGAKIQSDRDAVRYHPNFGPMLSGIDDEGQKKLAMIGELIKARNKSEGLAEHARLLYVGMTRARDYLVLSGSPEPAANSWLEALEGTFGALARSDGETFSGSSWEAVVRRTATAAEAPHRAREADGVDWDACLARATQPITMAPRMPGYSVSALLQALADDPTEPHDEARHESGDALPNRAVLARGSAAHAYFERWRFGDAPPDAAALLLALAYPEAQSAALCGELDAMAAWFVQTPLYARLTLDAAPLKEHPFALRVEDAIVSGTIDLLLSDGTIVDYKTGKRHAEREQRYGWQLQWYAAAVRALGGNTPSEAWLVYVDGQELVPVDVSEAAVETAMETARAALRRLRQAAAG
jgi:ATP-dependent helicase/nuclease subunit A